MRTKPKRSAPNFPRDLAVLFAEFWLLLPLLVVLSLTWNWARASIVNGDPTLLWIATGLGVLGSAVLGFARLPFYRERRPFQIGPGGLDAVHRRLYFAAYALVALSIGLYASVIFLSLVV